MNSNNRCVFDMGLFSEGCQIDNRMHELERELERETRPAPKRVEMTVKRVQIHSIIAKRTA